MKQGVVAAEVIAGDRASAFDPVAVPNCVYTDPEVATVGLSEEEAKAPATRCGSASSRSSRRVAPAR
jgi:pyruvate/2-oxoglutarate dehydrogenase complex dihydrolipoamide dehydrogenase (E3) component